MKWHLIVGLLVASLLYEAVAGHQTFISVRNRSRSRRDSPTNLLPDEKPKSKATVTERPRNARFSYGFTTQPYHFQPLPQTTGGHLPRNRSPLPSPSGRSGTGAFQRYTPETGTFRPPTRLNPTTPRSTGHASRFPSGGSNSLSNPKPSTSRHS